MSNVQRVQALYDTTRAGDFAAFAALCDKNLVWTQNEGFPYGGRHVGPDAVVEGVYRTLGRHWAEFRFAIEEMHDAGNSVTVVGTYAGRHKDTGKSFRAAAVHLIELKDGLIMTFRQYTDTALIRDATH